MSNKISLGLIAGFLPLIVFGAAPTDIKSLISMFTTDLVNPLIALFSTLAVLYFVWGIAKYISSAGDQKKAQEGKSVMTYGILALFVLFSFWGIIQFIHTDIFG